MDMAIIGIYNGKNIETKESFNVNQRFLLIPINDGSPKINKQKQALINELYGSLEGTEITLEELKEERLQKYENIT